MDQREQEQRPVRREYGSSTAADSIGQARRVIDQLEARINDARRVPMSKTLSIVDTGELIDLIGQLRIVLPHTVVQAQAILEQQKQILGDAKAEADRTADKADEIYTTTVEKAKQFEQEVKADADAYDKQIRQKAQEDSSAIVADANTRAEQIIFNAQQQSQKLVEDNEITRRAQAYAVETRERAEKDADSIYNQACVQVDKMLSGAAAALSRSASELAALRDNLLTQGSAQQQDLGVCCQRPDQGAALAHPAGELSRQFPGKIRETVPGQELPDPVLGLGGVLVPDGGGQGHVGPDGLPGEKLVLLGHEPNLGSGGTDGLPVHQDLSGSGALQSGNEAQQGGLAAAGRAHDAEELPLLHLKADIPKSLHLPVRGLVGEGHVLEINHHACACLLCCKGSGSCPVYAPEPVPVSVETREE